MPEREKSVNGIPPRKIREVAEELQLDTERILPHGHYIAKIPIDELEARQKQPDGKLILVTAMTPTPQGEGKTTTTVGLADALRRLGLRSMFCLREPSLGPYFGIKGGGTGAGRAQVVPAKDINLHFVGDIYAVEKANNLLCAMVDNHLQHGNELGLDPRPHRAPPRHRPQRTLVARHHNRPRRTEARRAAPRWFQHHASLRSHGHSLSRT